MALVVKDRVQVSSSTTGTGTLTLGVALGGFQDFSVIGDGNTTYYAITSNGEWEVGIGTYTASGTTLSRDTVLESSNSGSKINLSGTSAVFCTYPAEKSVYYDASGNVEINITGSSGSVANNLTAGTNISFSSGTTYNGSAAITINASNSFPSGTRLSFQQTAAPTGWTKDTTANLNDSIMRIVTGSASNGGSTAFSTFNGQTTVGSTTLSTSQIPSHFHVSGFAGVNSNASFGVSTTAVAGNINSQSGTTTNNHAKTSSVGGGGSHNHSITTSIKYYDFIVASKD